MGNQGRAGGDVLKDMGCMLWKAGDAGEGLAAEVRKNVLCTGRQGYDATDTNGPARWNVGEKKGRRARKHGKGGGEKVFFLFVNRSAKGNWVNATTTKTQKKKERKIVPYWADQKSEVPAPYRTVRYRAAWHSVGYPFRVNVPPQRLAATPANLVSMGIKGKGLKDLGVCERRVLSGVRGSGTCKRAHPTCRLPSLRFFFFWFQKKLMGRRRTRNERPGVWVDWDSNGIFVLDRGRVKGCSTRLK